MESEAILDASSVLALLNGEAGSNVLAAFVGRAAISAVNYSELVAKLVERGGDPPAVRSQLAALNLNVVPFDESLAFEAGVLRTATRSLGLSLADRVCLALDLPILTADRKWARVELSVPIVLIR